MEVITKEELRQMKDAQADRMRRYKFMLWIMDRRKRHDGHQGIQ